MSQELGNRSVSGKPETSLEKTISKDFRRFVFSEAIPEVACGCLRCMGQAKNHVEALTFTKDQNVVKEGISLIARQVVFEKNLKDIQNL